MKRLVAVLLFVLLAASPVAAQKIVRVTILPFDSAEAGEYAKLSDTLTSMLTSRIVNGGAVELVDRPIASSELNRLRDLEKSGRHPADMPKMDADFLIKGSLYTVQSGLQLHLSVIPLAGNAEPRNFSAFANAENQIIPAVEDLAQSASTLLRGEGMPAEAPPGLSANVAENKASAGLDNEHPDLFYRRQVAHGYGGVVTAESGTVQAVMQHGEPMGFAANAMAMGDLDGDGKREVAIVSGGSLRLFSLDDKMHSEALATYLFPPDVRANMVSIAPLVGGSGLAIYVSTSEGTRPYGAIFTYHGGKLLAKMKGIPWYIRPVNKPGEGVQLLGQAGNDRPEMGYLGQGVHRLRPRPDFSGLIDEGLEALPQSVGVFDFAWLDVDGDGKIEVAAIDAHSKLKIFNSQGQLLWVSQDEYGGSSNFIGPSLADDQNSNSGVSRLLRYIPARILVLDGKGGKNELIVSANDPAFTNTWLRNSRDYNGGRLKHLVWDGSGMRETWKTTQLSGYISDYDLVQSVGDKADALQLVVTQRPGRAFLGFTLDDSTVLVGYRIAAEQEKNTPTDEKGADGIKN